ncbi:MAG: hypothetical protein ACI867_002019 [Glaciecola sp.]|jgi:uncharacterized protein (DUF2236 family)
MSRRRSALGARPEALLASVFPDGLPVLRGLMRVRLTKVFGGPPIRPDGHAGDPGLFGPGAASWQVLGDPASIPGGVRGLMLQTLHPATMAGVHDHSAFTADPLGRLQRTTAWVIASAFGSVGEVLHAARRVRAAHTVVRGTTPGGQPYAAQDPHLLSWVQCSLTASFLATDQAYAAYPVSAERADQFVAQQSMVAALLDPRVDLESLDHDGLRAGTVRLPMISEGTLPTTVAELRAVMDSFDSELEVNHQSREALAYLKAPPLAPLLRAAYGVVYLGAVATFDERQRRRLGLPLPLPVSIAQATARLNLTALRTAAGRSPTVIAATERAAA